MENARIAGKMILQQPDVLLLDELTNHLDLPPSNGSKNTCSITKAAW